MAEDRSGRFIDLTGRGLEFILHFKDMATKPVEGVSAAMDKLLKGMESMMRKARDQGRHALDALMTLQDRLDRERGFVTAMGASKHAPDELERLRILTQRLAQSQLELMEKHRIELERLLGSYTKVGDESKEVGEEIEKDTDRVGKFVDALGKIGVTAYGAKRLGGMFVDWTAEMADARGELERLQIAMTTGKPEIKAWREEAKAAAEDLVGLTLSTRTTTEEQLQVYRLLMQQNIAFRGLGRAIAEESLKLGKFTQLGAEGFEQMFAYLHKTLDIAEKDMPRAMDRVAGAMLIARRDGVASFADVQEQMNRLSDSSTYLYNRLRNTGVGMEEAQNRALRFTERAAALGTVLREVGLNTDLVQSAFNTLTKVGTDEFNRLVTFIAGNSGVAAEHIQEMLDAGDPTAFMEALLSTAQNFSGRIGDLTAEVQQRMLGTLGQDIQHLTQITAAQQDKLRDRMNTTFRELDANARKPVLWDKTWKEFSETFGQLYERLTAVGRAFKNDLGLTLSTFVLPILKGTVRLMEYLFVKVEDGQAKLTTFGHAMQIAFTLAAAAVGTFFTVVSVRRLLMLVSSMEEFSWVLTKISGLWPLMVRGATAFMSAMEGASLASIGAALLNPWVAIPALIIGATVLVYKYWDTIKEGYEGAKMFMHDLWVGMKDLWNTSTFGQWINTIVSGIGTVVSALIDVGKVIANAIIWPFSKLADLVGDIFDWIWAKLPDWGKTLLKLGSGALRMLPGVGPLMQAGDMTAGVAGHGRDVQSEQDRLAHIERLMAAGYTREQAESFSKKVTDTGTTEVAAKAADPQKALAAQDRLTAATTALLDSMDAGQKQQEQATTATEALTKSMVDGQKQQQQVVSAQMLAYQQVQRILQQSLSNQSTQAAGITDIQRAIAAVNAGKNFKAPDAPTPGHAVAAYVAGEGAPAIALPDAPKPEQYDNRMAYRDALDKWRADRDRLTQQVDEAWQNRQQASTPAAATPDDQTSMSSMPLGRQRDRVPVDNSDVVGAITGTSGQIVEQLVKLNQNFDRANGSNSAVGTWRGQQ